MLAVPRVSPDVALGPRTRARGPPCTDSAHPPPLCADIVLPQRGWAVAGGGGAGPVGIGLPGLGWAGCREDLQGHRPRPQAGGAETARTQSGPPAPTSPPRGTGPASGETPAKLGGPLGRVTSGSRRPGPTGMAWESEVWSGPRPGRLLLPPPVPPCPARCQAVTRPGRRLPPRFRPSPEPSTICWLSGGQGVTVDKLLREAWDPRPQDGSLAAGEGLRRTKWAAPGDGLCSGRRAAGRPPFPGRHLSRAGGCLLPSTLALGPPPAPPMSEQPSQSGPHSASALSPGGANPGAGPRAPD